MSLRLQLQPPGAATPKQQYSRFVWVRVAAGVVQVQRVYNRDDIDRNAE